VTTPEQLLRSGKGRTGFRALSTLFALGLFVAVACAPAVAQQPEFRQVLEQFAGELAADVQADGIGSIAVAVIAGDHVEWAHAFGWADRDRQIPANARTIYRIGSISKSITAIAMARQVRRGAFTVEDPVVKWLPEFATLDGDPAAVRSITLAQLASHTAGLIREPRLEGAASGPIDGWESKVIASIPHTSLRTPPGRAYSYSNIGFGILGLAISRAAHVPFMTLVTSEVFEPLGMTSSWFVVPQSEWSRVATGYANDARGNVDAELPAKEHAGRGYKVPNGGVYSTVGDLSRVIALMTGALGDDVLPPASRDMLTMVHTPGDTASGYGFGFQIRTDREGNRFVSHGGSVAGYTANIAFHPASRVGVVLLRNYNTGRTNLAAASERLLARLVAAVPAGR
jgi:CubicO group peptidase (beta-lactamase class C family)